MGESGMAGNGGKPSGCFRLQVGDSARSLLSLASTDAIPEAMIEVANSVFYASILRDRHEDDDCCDQEVPSSRSATIISGAHGVFLTCKPAFSMAASDRGQSKQLNIANILNERPLPDSAAAVLNGDNWASAVIRCDRPRIVRTWCSAAVHDVAGPKPWKLGCSLPLRSSRQSPGCSTRSDMTAGAKIRTEQAAYSSLIRVEYHHQSLALPRFPSSVFQAR
jgi:hypothetical protein